MNDPAHIRTHLSSTGTGRISSRISSSRISIIHGDTGVVPASRGGPNAILAVIDNGQDSSTVRTNMSSSKGCGADQGRLVICPLEIGWFHRNPRGKRTSRKLTAEVTIAVLKFRRIREFDLVTMFAAGASSSYHLRRRTRHISFFSSTTGFRRPWEWFCLDPGSLLRNLPVQRTFPSLTVSLGNGRVVQWTHIDQHGSIINRCHR
jgi:hypothetical protein